ncbi:MULTISPECIES: methyl-accepting chemotaxis protein [Paenibacillus]|uniref:methyl-accepting chemotaxis protein n=1 Tax=Paenibacillus TaxID=44249 RepID=UPI0022B8AD00|nr:methyl-accepting chemotaxis protein [Paenibacillus caseinilyticus]MCZ8522641.1 methyl-accepting chemotaxis protein [Paenibacillus caseinilyticus]
MNQEQQQQLTEAYFQRNKVVLILFWIFALVPIIMISALSGGLQLAAANIVMLVAGVVITVLSRFKHLARLTAYIASAAFVLFYIGAIVAKSVDPTLPIVLAVLPALYPSYRPVAVTSVFIFLTTLISSGFSVLNPVQFLVSGTFSFMIIVIVCITVVRLTEKMLRDIASRNREATEAKMKSEAMLQQVQDALTTLNGFNRQLQEKVAVTQKISREVNLGFSEVSQGIEAQAISVGDINELMKKSNEDIQDVARNSQTMRQLSSETGRVTVQGNEQIGDLTRKINQADSIVDTIYGDMQELNKENEQIGTILTTIQDMANQTNLLALNAAIEAARAGEHGRGFAVVSSEVRKLAENSSQSAVAITQILSSIRERTERLTGQVAGGKKALEDSIGSARQTEDLLRQIADNTHQVLQQAEEVEGKTTDIGKSSGEIVMEVTSISGVTEQSSAAAEEILASVEEQNAMMDQIVNSFKELEQLIADLNRAAE